MKLHRLTAPLSAAAYVVTNRVEPPKSGAPSSTSTNDATLCYSNGHSDKRDSSWVGAACRECAHAHHVNLSPNF